MTRSHVLIGLIMAFVLFGVVFRIYPIFTGMPDLAEAFITEDGYLMLTVARNMAIGLGMTVSEGTILTNGVQPMATFLFTLPYLATGGDRVEALVGIHLILAMISVGALIAIRAFAARMLRGQDAGVLLPWLVAALWFLGPVLLRHSMNALETGLITLVAVAVLLQFGRVIGQGADARLVDRLGLGLLCGLVFVARIDAAILVVAIFAVWTLDLLIRQRLGFGTVFAWLMPAGLLSLAVAAPWLLNNYLGFGSIMPSSGPAQSLNAEFAAHAALIPAKIFEYLFPMLPVPRPFERRLVMMVIFGAVAVIIMLAFLVQVLRKGDSAVRAMVMAYTLHAVALVAYYGLFFGAPHFLSRYLAPLAPLFIVAAVWVALDLGRLVMRTRPRFLALLYGWGGVVLSVALLIRLLLPGAPQQGHEQVIAWTQENVPHEAWIGAVQTGTLGYWHDRTINLDGKVNPDALAARQTEGHVLAYVTESEIDYIVDWAGLASWLTRPEGQPYFAEAFEVVVDDPATNLSVLRRRIPRHDD